MASTCAKDLDGKFKKCAKTRKEGHEECIQTRDDGYNQCTQTRDDGYNKCCTWWPCSWGCKAVVWVSNVVCVASTWVSHIVCVASKWVENIVCVAWKLVPAIVCIAADVVSSGLNIISTILDATIGLLLSVLGFIVSIITSLPGIGRVLGWAWNLVIGIVNVIISLPDAALTLVGIMPEKRLRLGVVILRNGQHEPVTNIDIVRPAIQYAINTFRTEVNVRVIPITPFYYRSAFAENPAAGEAYVFIDDTSSSDNLLDVCCESCAAGKDLIHIGADFNIKMSRLTFWGNGRRLLGYGAPIVAFAIRKFTDNHEGCSLGPLTDFVTVNFKLSPYDKVTFDKLTPDRTLGSVTTLAHEMVHACNRAGHINDQDKLMNPNGPRKGHLTLWEKIAVRTSKHVTYL